MSVIFYPNCPNCDMCRYQETCMYEEWRRINKILRGEKSEKNSNEGNKVTIKKVKPFLTQCRFLQTENVDFEEEIKDLSVTNKDIKYEKKDV